MTWADDSGRAVVGELEHVGWRLLARCGSWRVECVVEVPTGRTVTQAIRFER